MKRIITVLTITLLIGSICAQSPEKMSYQAIVRNSNNEPVTNKEIGMRISILQGSPDGTPVYIESQTPTSTSYGLVILEIGTGNTTDDFSSIDWSNGSYYIKTETDLTGGTNYTISGTVQLLSVPYALYAKSAETVTGPITESDPVFTSSQAVHITENDILNLSNLSGENTGDQDLSDLVDQSALSDSTMQLRSEIPDISYLATKSALGDSSAAIRDNIPEISNFVTKAAFTDTVDVLRNENFTGNYSDLSGQPSIRDSIDAYGFTGDMKSQRISNLADPVNLQDAVTKAYIDSIIDSLKIELLLVMDTKIELKHGTSVADLYSSGYSIQVLLSAGASIDDLLAAGASIEELLANNISVSDLLDAGVSANDFIGLWYQGGIIFYVDAANGTGLISAPVDQSSGVRWGYSGCYDPTGADGYDIGTGASNTLAIVTECSEETAASVCANTTLNGYSDWFLPSIHELYEMFIHKSVISSASVANGGVALADAFYWSSSHYGSGSGLAIAFQNSSNSQDGSTWAMSYTFRVRAVRAF